MGCNTSKESVPQTEGENKEVGDVSPEDKNTENHVNDCNETKSPSARTITLRTADDKVPANTPQVSSQSSAHETDKAVPDQADEAATKIQAAFRGHRTRASMKQPAAKTGSQHATSGDVPTRAQLEEEFQLDDPDLCDAATKIQASFRGHMTRKHEAEKRHDESGTSHKKHPEHDDLDIDLSDPDLNKAAVKIQASFRGHMVRKEHEGDEHHVE